MLVILLGYMASGWLIDRSYHLEYFLLAGAVSAFHRRLGVEHGIVSEEGEVLPEEYEENDEEEASPWDRTKKEEPQEAEPESDAIFALEEVDTSEAAQQAIEEERSRRWYWRRFGLIDALLVFAFTKVVFGIWDHLLKIYFL